MIKKHKTDLFLFACLIAITLCVVPLNNAVAINQKAIRDWIVSYTTYDTTYEAILKMYLKVINGYGSKNYGRHDLFNNRVIWDGPSDAPIDYLIKYSKEKVGYYIEDINKDGIDELVICASLGRIYEIFTIDEGKVREVFRGSRYGACHLINNDLIFRHYQIEGEDYDYYELWQMNGTGKAIFLEGYHHAVWRSDNTDIWKRSETDIRSLNPDKSKGAQASEAEGWVTDLESRIVRHRYIPFVIYEKYPDDPWDIGVLAKNNKSTGSAKIRIRQAPSNKSKIIETKRVGTYVKILAEENGYYKIRIGKKEGYVQKEYLIPVTWQEK